MELNQRGRDVEIRFHLALLTLLKLPMTTDVVSRIDRTVEALEDGLKSIAPKRGGEDRRAIALLKQDVSLHSIGNLLIKGLNHDLITETDPHESEA